MSKDRDSRKRGGSMKPRSREYLAERTWRSWMKAGFSPSPTTCTHSCGGLKKSIS
ncbi:MAG: hypothetical protein QXL40_04645 [Nitrososphaerota archaeon]